MVFLWILAAVILTIFITGLFFANRKSEWEQRIEDEEQMKFVASFKF